MTSIEVFTCKNSKTYRTIHDSSLSGNLTIDRVARLDVANSDELLIESLKQSDPDKTLIVFYNDLKTSLESTQILDYLEHFIDNVETYDVFYLSRYSDDCRMHTDFHPYKHIDYFKVVSPHGIEGLMISPAGKQKLIGKLKPSNGRGVDFMLNAMSAKMSNYSSFPLIYHVDMTTIHDDSERIKGVLCRENLGALKPPRLTARNGSLINFLWFIFVLILIFCFGASCLSVPEQKVDPKIDTGITPELPFSDVEEPPLIKKY